MEIANNTEGVRNPACPAARAESLQCLEVWGGNRWTDKRLTVTGMDVAVCARPWQGHESGGDVYLVSMCACAEISRYVLADVSGHGNSVAPLAERLRKIMFKHINQPDQTRVAEALNRELSAFAQEGWFTTALMLTYLPETGQLFLCNAGHPPPLWYRRSTGAWELAGADARDASPELDLPFGILPGTQYQQSVINLEQGDLLVLYSDGLTDVRSANGQPLGVNGFAQLVARLSPEPAALAGAIIEKVSAMEANEPDDDQTVIVLHHTASKPPHRNLLEKLPVLARLIGLKAGMLLDSARGR